MKKTNLTLIITIITLLVILLAQPINFYEPVTLGTINQNNLSTIRSSDTIRCKWNATEDTVNTTASWYENGNTTPFIEQQVLVEYNDLAPEYTIEEDTWNCTIQITNSSGITTTSSTTIYVEYDPLTYIQNITGPFSLIETTFNLIEDENYTVKWNTTYSTFDNYELVPDDGMCIEQTDGEAICSPTTNHLGTNKNTSGSQIIVFKYNYDNYESSQGHSINFSIIAVNDAPTYTVTNATINETNEWINAITVTDEEGNFPVNFTVEQPSFCNYTNTTNSITFNCTPWYLDAGNYTINLSVVDNPPPGINPVSTNKSFNVEVHRVNHIPEITYTSNFPANQSDYYNITINATDLYDNNTMNFSINGNGENCNLLSQNPWNNTQTTWENVTWNNSGQYYTSFAIGRWNNTLTNDNVICRNVTITVTDSYLGSSNTTIYLNISNTNDPPHIENYSANSGDNLNNHYIYNITSYEYAPLIYHINATDPDLLVEYNFALDSFNESLTYVSNDTWLNIYLNNITGLLNISRSNMTLTAGNYTYLINVTDNGGNGTNTSSNTTIMNIEVMPNDPPYFNQTLNFSCYEKDSLNYNNSCNINLSLYAKDDNPGDLVTNFSDDSNNFNITNNGLLLFNATQEQVDIHTFNVTITDSRGSTNITEMTLYIYNTNNRPTIQSVEDRTPPKALYRNKETNNKIPIIVTDLDLNLTGTNETDLDYAYENIIFTWLNNNESQNLTGYVSISPNITTNSSNVFLIVNTTKLVNGSLIELGDYSINITVQDNYFNHSNQSSYDNHTFFYNFTVHNTTAPPEIKLIYPYGQPQVGNMTIDWLNLTGESVTTYTTINVTENTALLFNQSSWDENISTLIYKWYYDEILLNNISTINYDSTITFYGTNSSLNFRFGYFEVDHLGTENHNLTLVVIDGFDNSLNDTFRWDIEVTDKNRPIVLNESISNVTLEGSRNKDNRDLWKLGLGTGFYDPDYDYNGDGLIEAGEGNFNITYIVSDYLCDGYATFGVEDNTCNELECQLSDIYTTYLHSETNNTLTFGHGFAVEGQLNGSCTVNFTASDGQFSVTSNNVLFNVTAIAQTAPESVEVVESSGVKTVTVTEVVSVPLPEEVEKPVYISILMPDMVSIYENNTLEIPITIINTWNQTIYGIFLDYATNDTLEYTVKFQRDTFYQILPGQEIKTTMTIKNYRVGGIYEITLLANVTDPPYQDQAKIYLNSLEQSTTGTKLRTLVRFAQDLLKKNKECQELGEILQEAQDKVANNNYEGAMELLDSMINGCKYLISEQQKKQAPKRLRDIHIPLKKEYLTYLLIAGLSVFSIIGAVTLFRKKT